VGLVDLAGANRIILPDAADPDLELLRSHLDPVFYLERYPDVRRLGVDPAFHYLHYGGWEGRDPRPDFSTRFYVECNPELRRAGINPFLHYLRQGLLEGRPGAPEALSAESRARLLQAGDGRGLRSAGESGHIPDRSGALERSPSGTRHGSDAGVIARLIVQAKKLSRFLLPDRRQRAYMRKVRASGLFDEGFYTTSHVGLRWLFRRFPVRHYVTIGEREHLQPNPEFSGRIYLHYNPDVAHAGIPPFLHYVEIGHRELRVTKELPGPVQSLARAMPKLVPAPATADLAVVAHIFYHDLWDEIADRLAGAGIAFDLFVTITDKGAETDELLPRIAERFPRARTLRYPNRGRDVLPFVHLVNAGALDGYRAVCKVHTKRSPHRQDGDHWRRHLIAGILPGSWPAPGPRSGWRTASTTARPTGGARTASGWRSCWRGSRSAWSAISPSRPARCTG
jgi:hypothetical protein